MRGWTMILRAAVASALACLSLAASMDTPNTEADAPVSEPVVASVTDEQQAGADKPSEEQPPESRVVAHISDEPLDPTAQAVAQYRELQGSVLETSPNLRAGEAAGEFAAALARIVREQPLSEASIPGESLTETATSPLTPPAETSGSDLLRGAAREIELRAAGAEDRHHFADADQLRDLATAIRREARRWDESDSSGSPAR